MENLKILKEDIQNQKKSNNQKMNTIPKTSEKNKKVSGNINISYTLNLETGKYTFLYSINNLILEVFMTNAFSEGIEHILKMVKENALKINNHNISNNTKKKSNIPKPKNKEENFKIKSLF